MLSAAMWADVQTVLLTKVNQRDTNIIWNHVYSESKNGTKSTYLQNRNGVTEAENTQVI